MTNDCDELIFTQASDTTQQNTENMETGASASTLVGIQDDGKHKFGPFQDDMCVMRVLMQLKPWDAEHGWASKAWKVVPRYQRNKALMVNQCQQRLETLLKKCERESKQHSRNDWNSIIQEEKGVCG